MRAYLLIPDLWPPPEMEEAARGLRLPGLELLLGKGTVADARGETVEGWLCRRFGVERRGDWPVAAVTLLADGGDPGRDVWMRADPVSLRADGARLVLGDGAWLRITPGEAAALAQALNRHFREDGLEFEPRSPRRWYLRLPAAPAMSTHAPHEAAGRHVDEWLPAGPDALHWHRLMNEAQMLLHQHPVNEAREERGEPPLNSVWLWGAGAVPDHARASFAGVWSNHPLAAGLARLAGIAAHPVPCSGAEWLREATGAEVLLVLEDLGGGGAWREALQALENTWFSPLAEALRSKRLARLDLGCPAPARSRELVVEAGDFWKFWRGPRRLA
jgi:hypothetical protein